MEEMTTCKQEGKRFGRIRSLFCPVAKRTVALKDRSGERRRGPVSAHSEDKDELS